MFNAFCGGFPETELETLLKLVCGPKYLKFLRVVRSNYGVPPGVGDWGWPGAPPPVQETEANLKAPQEETPRPKCVIQQNSAQGGQ